MVVLRGGEGEDRLRARGRESIWCPAKSAVRERCPSTSDERRLRRGSNRVPLLSDGWGKFLTLYQLDSADVATHMICADRRPRKMDA